MVAQVLADTGDIGNRVDPRRLQLLRRADAGCEQDARRADRARTQHHFAAASEALDAPVPDDLDRTHPAIFNLKVEHLGLRHDRQVRTAKHRAHEGGKGREALALVLGDVVDPEAELAVAIEVAVLRQARLTPGLDPHPRHGVRIARVVDQQFAVKAMVPRILGELVALERLEHRQHVLVGPAVAAKPGPLVVILGCAANIDHGVDGARATQRLAAVDGDPAVVEMRLGNTDIAIIELRIAVE